MSFPHHIYKAYDIRGIYPEELDEDRAYRTVRWFADMRSQEAGKKKITLVVGRDMRLSSPMVADAVKRAVKEQGADVVDIGLVSTPTFYHAVASGGYDGGIIVSASHNPKEYTGLKLVRDHAEPVSKDTGIDTLRELVASGELPSPFAAEGMERTLEDVTLDAARAAYAFMDGEALVEDATIAIDPANCMGAQDMDALFAGTPARILRMNWELDGSFPSHEPDPLRPENLESLCEKVRASGADFGIGLDGDADRIFFVDEKGAIVSPVATRTLLAEIMLRRHPGATVVYDVRPGKITEDVIRAQGGVPVIVRVGHSFIKEKMIETNAIFAGESSGHLFVRFPYGVFEQPIVVVLLVLSEMARTKKKISELVAPYYRYAHSGEINFKVHHVGDALHMIVDHFSDRGTPGYLDGVSFDFGDVWFNVRGSNTEPLLRLNVEGKNVALVQEIVDAVGALVR